jgi:hypoxanthine phosphoribosyltransferase
MWTPVERTLLSEAQIDTRVRELAATISADYRGEEVLLVGVLRGAFIFLADLARRLTVQNRVDFIALASYDGTESGAVRLLMDLREDVAGRHVLLVEDIVDRGRTLDYLLRLLGARRPASLRCCALLRKPARLEIAATVDYLGFDIPDEWVVGYGLDYADQHRTLPYVGVVRPPRG